ncbi:right-handed parallel beta-helix repeat-containing protein [Myxococcota bacterium]
MPKTALPILCFVMGSSLPIMSAGAATFHVDVNGDDTANDGSSSSPFRTIQKGADTANAGDSVFVHAGIYYERVYLNNSGAPGQPITIEGELGANGERLAIVDGGTPAVGWVPAPEVAAGVYKTTSIAFEPYSMVVEENGVVRDIPRIHKSNGLDYLSLPADATEVTYYLEVEVDFWDGIEALYFYDNGTTYLRFRNGDDPTSKTIRASMGTWVGAGFKLHSKSHITVRNFVVRAAFRGFNLARPETHHVTIENNEIYATGREKIYVEATGSDIEIAGNLMYMSSLSSYRPGAWNDQTDGTAPYAQAVREHIYYGYKVYLSPGSNSGAEDRGIALNETGPSPVRIHGNHVSDTLVGISVFGDSNAEIHDNTVSKISSVGIVLSQRAFVSVHDNLIYDCNILFRFGTCEDASGNRVANIYNNRLYNPEGVGSHTYFHYASESSSPSDFSDFWFYHNSFAGGYRVFNISAYAHDHGGLRNTRFINNIFSGKYCYGGTQGFYDGVAMVEIFDYNWLGGAFSWYGKSPIWLGATNIDAEGNQVWDASSLPDFILPDGHAARGSGIDVSVPFNIGGQVYQPLPGMEPGYFSGTGPNMGALQDVEPVERTAKAF